jgi:hypothetical protein
MKNPRVLVFSLAAGLCACSPNYERRQPPVSDAAEQMSKLAANPKQAELWKQATGRANDQLTQLPVAARPVQARPKTGGPDKAVDSKTVALPQGQPNAVRILSIPELPGDSYSGPVKIARVEGERIDLDLGQSRTLSLLVRLRSGAVRAQPGDTAQLEVRRRTDPRDRAEILAFRAASGDGIVSVLESGKQPVTVRVPSFRLAASQVAKPENGTMPVQVSIGDERQVLQQGQIADFKRAGMRVGVVASMAVTGEDVNREEGNPYAIRLLAWPVQ